MRRLTGMALAIVLVAAAGGMALAGGKNGLANTRWSLVAFGPADAPAPLAEGSAVTLQFGADGRAGGSGGCNSYGGDFKADDEALTFGPIISTKRACADEAVMRQEQRYFEALQSATGFEVDGDHLKVAYDGGVLDFVRAQEK